MAHRHISFLNFDVRTHIQYVPADYVGLLEIGRLSASKAQLYLKPHILERFVLKFSGKILALIEKWSILIDMQLDCL